LRQGPILLAKGLFQIEIGRTLSQDGRQCKVRWGALQIGEKGRSPNRNKGSPNRDRALQIEIGGCPNRYRGHPELRWGGEGVLQSERGAPRIATCLIHRILTVQKDAMQPVESAASFSKSTFRGPSPPAECHNPEHARHIGKVVALIQHSDRELGSIPASGHCQLAVCTFSTCLHGLHQDAALFSCTPKMCGLN